MRRLLCLVLLVLAIAPAARAQDPSVVKLDVLYLSSAGVVVATDTTSAPFGPPIAMSCNLAAPVVPATVLNPTRVFFDDTANVGKVCVVTLNAATVAALPNGTGYTIVVVATDALGQASPRSAASNPFSRQAGPAARTGLKVVPD